MGFFNDDRVSIYNKGQGQKINGVYIPGSEVFIKDIFVDIQPYSSELLLKDYGYNIEVSNRIFADIDIDLHIGTILKVSDSQSFEVRKIISWDDYCEVMVYEV